MMGDAHNYLDGTNLADLCRLSVIGSGAPVGLMVTNREIDDPSADQRRLTAERLRLAEHLMKPSPVREMLIAHKTISEWVTQDPNHQKPVERTEALAVLERDIKAAGYRPGTPGRPGGWLTSAKPLAQASTAHGTILQALRAFSAMIGRRNIYVIGREN